MRRILFPPRGPPRGRGGGKWATVTLVAVDVASIVGGFAVAGGHEGPQRLLLRRLAQRGRVRAPEAHGHVLAAKVAAQLALVVAAEDADLSPRVGVDPGGDDAPGRREPEGRVDDEEAVAALGVCWASVASVESVELGWVNVIQGLSMGVTLQCAAI